MQHKSWRIFQTTLAYSALVFLLELANTSHFLASSITTERFKLPWISFKHLGSALLSHLLLILIFSLFVTQCTEGFKRIFKSQPSSQSTVIIWGICLVDVFLANQYYFPLSQYAALTSAIVPTLLLLPLLSLITVLILSCFIISFKGPGKVLTLLTFIITIWLFYLPTQHELVQSSSIKKPNIIIIGIDSLRLEQLSHAKKLNAYINRSQNFTNAHTPLARTFPSWVSILTGLYPSHHHAIFNLAESKVAVSKSLAVKLKTLGYQSLFATDETRFSHIDQSFGFETVLSPKMGVNDFIQSTINDIPLANLSLKTPLGKWLFPYNHINRASFIHYDPRQFMKEIDSALNHLNANKPIFFATHLTLTHWPLLWGTMNLSQLPPKASPAYAHELYNIALRGVDTQFNKLISILKRKELLKNAIVFVISDHGDANLEPGTRATSLKNYQPPKKNHFMDYLKKHKQTLNKSQGHGSDVLSTQQYKTLLAIHFYPQKIFARSHNPPVSLIDIKATVLDAIGETLHQSDGVSLLPQISNPQAKSPPRLLYLETGFNPDINIYNGIDMSKIAYISKTFYTVNTSNDRVVLKKELLNKLSKQKQVAVLYGDWLLGLYPVRIGYIPVLINLKTHKWTDVLASKFAKQSPVKIMLHHLRKTYRLNSKQLISS